MRRTTSKIAAVMVSALLFASLGATNALAEDDGPTDIRFETTKADQRDLFPPIQVWLAHFSGLVRMAGRFAHAPTPPPAANPAWPGMNGVAGSFYFLYPAPEDTNELPGDSTNR